MSTLESSDDATETRLQHHFGVLASFFAEKRLQCPDESKDLAPLTAEEIARINTLLYECTKEELLGAPLKNVFSSATPFKSATASFTTTPALSTPFSKPTSSLSQRETPITRQKECPVALNPAAAKPASPINMSKPMTETAKFILQTLDAAPLSDAPALPLPSASPLKDTGKLRHEISSVTGASASIPPMPSQLRHVIKTGRGSDDSSEEDNAPEAPRSREPKTQAQVQIKSPCLPLPLPRLASQQSGKPSAQAHATLQPCPLANDSTASPPELLLPDLPVYAFADPLQIKMSLEETEGIYLVSEASLPTFTF